MEASRRSRLAESVGSEITRTAKTLMSPAAGHDTARANQEAGAFKTGGEQRVLVRFSGLDSMDATGASERCQSGVAPFFGAWRKGEQWDDVDGEDSRLVSSSGKNGLV